MPSSYAESRRRSEDTVSRNLDRHRRARDELLAQLRAEGITDAVVLCAIEHVPRHELVPPALIRDAYVDAPLPIGRGQTISQPYIVALMSQLLEVSEGDRVLEIGTGSGYQSAVLAAMGCEVYSVERIAELGECARRRLDELGYHVRIRIGDGSAGWPEAAPFDGIIVTAAPEIVPTALIDQLRPGARLIVPVGTNLGVQYLTVICKRADGSIERSEVAPVRFVPLLTDTEE
jgi:protein-L-isoaspartate(D-aspartate) O-methyltransferase